LPSWKLRQNDMVLFLSKKETKETKAPENKEVKKVVAPKKVLPDDQKFKANATVGTLELVIKAPRVTEKSAYQSEKGAYVFNVESSATKKQIAKAVESIYNVKPVKVNTTQIAHKQVFVRGKKVVKSGGKKAYVYLKKGETIEII